MMELAPIFRARWSASAAAFDLAPAQAQALRWLEPGKAKPMSSLAGALICDASNVTGIVDKLEARGLVVRQGDPADRRVKMLAVTEAGAELRQRLIASASEPPPAISGLSTAEQKSLCDLLAKMVGFATAERGE